MVSVTLANSDTYLLYRGSHCKRGGLYSLNNGPIIIGNLWAAWLHFSHFFHSVCLIVLSPVEVRIFWTVFSSLFLQYILGIVTSDTDIFGYSDTGYTDTARVYSDTCDKSHVTKNCHYMQISAYSYNFPLSSGCHCNQGCMYTEIG